PSPVSLRISWPSSSKAAFQISSLLTTSCPQLYAGRSGCDSLRIGTRRDGIGKDGRLPPSPPCRRLPCPLLCGEQCGVGLCRQACRTRPARLLFRLDHGPVFQETTHRLCSLFSLRLVIPSLARLAIDRPGRAGFRVGDRPDALDVETGRVAEMIEHDAGDLQEGEELRRT